MRKTPADTQAERRDGRPGDRSTGTRTEGPGGSDTDSVSRKAALRQRWHDLGLAARPQRVPGKNSPQARSLLHPPCRRSFFPRGHGELFQTPCPGACRRASVILTDIPFPLTHNVPCAIEFPGAEVARPVRSDSCRHKDAFRSAIGDQQ